MHGSQVMMGMGPSSVESQGKAGISRPRDPRDLAERESFLRKKPKFSLQDDSVGANEIASAFALASLASMSQDSMLFETRDVENNHASSDDSHDPEMRSADKDEPALVAREDRPSPVLRRMSSGGKSVTFSPDTVHVERQFSRRAPMIPRSVARELAFRPPLPPTHGFSMRPSAPVPLYHQMHPQWQSRHRVMVPSGFSPPPMSAPRTPSSNQWICDFCNVASFLTYEEACVHEQGCRLRTESPRVGAMWSQPPRAPLPSQVHPCYASSMPSNNVPAASTDMMCLPAASDMRCFAGSTTLALPDSDSKWLSELNCFIRSDCVEAFSAGHEHVSSWSNRGPISVGQVGIRCRFCVHRPLEETGLAAVSFPASIAGIHESAKRWQTVHFAACPDVPDEVRGKIAFLASASSWTPDARQYWTDSAKSLGMVDTREGIRLAADPNSARHSHLDTQTAEAAAIQALSTLLPQDPSSKSTLSDGDPIVQADDATIVPPYVHFLMSQVVRCRFTEADRFVARSKGPVGYPGFQCRHCNGHAGLGKYFPVTSKSLSTNSTSQNIHAHILKCRKCPTELKQELVVLKEEKSKAPRLEPGWRKVFFDKIWTRMHG